MTVATTMTWGLTSALFSSFFICALLILTQRWHGKLSLDHDLNGAQKIHHKPVPRIGGLGLAMGLSTSAALIFADGEPTFQLISRLLLCAMPVFMAGLVEDLTKKVSVKARLYASFVSAAIAALVLDVHLTRLDTPGLDVMMTVLPFSIVFTCFAAGGMTHAINIIDGLNGLAAGGVAIMLAGLALISWQVGDVMVMRLCLLGTASLAGFLVLNFPFGRIFLGDGGAYLAGFWLAQCGILLLQRNPAVSTWAVLLCCLYPVWETVFSMYRRHLVQKVSSGKPDMVHLHHLIFRRVTNQTTRHPLPNWGRHALSSAMIWLMALACVAVASIWYDETSTLMASTFLFIFGYGWLYQSLRPNQHRSERKTETILPDRLT